MKKSIRCRSLAEAQRSAGNLQRIGAVKKYCTCKVITLAITPLSQNVSDVIVFVHFFYCITDCQAHRETGLKKKRDGHGWVAEWLHFWAGCDFKTE